jgi:hypothetical protein
MAMDSRGVRDSFPVFIEGFVALPLWIEDCQLQKTVGHEAR